MIAVGCAIRKVKNLILEKSQINISCANLTVPFEGL